MKTQIIMTHYSTENVPVNAIVQKNHIKKAYK